MQNPSSGGSRRRLLLLGAILGLLVACSESGPDSAWESLTAMEVARSEHPAVVSGDELMVFGGLVDGGAGAFRATDSVEAYSLDEDVWRALPSLPEPRHHAMAAVVDGRVFVMGGYDGAGFNPVDSVWELVDGEWIARAPLPTPIAGGSAVIMDDSIYVLGGSPNSELAQYHTDRDTWDGLGSLPSPREHLAAVAFDGEIWAIGGRWEGEVVDSVDVFDPSTGTWRAGPAMREARSGFGAVVVGDTIMVGGGEVFDPLVALLSTERLADGDWVFDEPLPFGVHGNPLVAAGEAIYVPGGSERPNGVENRGLMLRLAEP